MVVGPWAPLHLGEQPCHKGISDNAGGCRQTTNSPAISPECREGSGRGSHPRNALRMLCLISSCIAEGFCGVLVGCVQEKTGEDELFFCTCSFYKETQPIVPPPATCASQQAGRQAGLERPGNPLEKVISFIPLQDILSLLMFSAQ